MEQITRINFIKELEVEIKTVTKTISSYSLLCDYTRDYIVPLIRSNNVTVSVIESTTCGLLSDLLTSVSGASEFFIMGMTPYSNEMKIKIGFPKDELKFGGYGVVSRQAVEQLARCIRNYSGADLGIAETGLLASTELKKRRTQKKAGEVYAAILSKERNLIERLSVQQNLSRVEMRQEIAFRVLQLLRRFLE
ncbi:MAG: CinA family protein [Candidatus Hodarchaeota archaeon]